MLVSNWDFRERIDIRFELSIPEFQPQRMADWLRLLEIETHDYIPIESVLSHQTYLLFGIAFFRGMLLAGNVPNFESPKILSCVVLKEGLTPQLEVTLSVVVVELIPAALYSLSLKRCFEVFSLLARIEPQPSSKRGVYERLLQEVVVPLRRAIAMGQSTMHVLKEAHQKGIPFIHLGLGVFQLGWGSLGRLIDRSTTEDDSALGSRLSHDKPAAGALLKQAGLPYPEHVVVDSESELVEVVKRIGFPLVLKPSDRDCGVGVSVDICDYQALEAGFKIAKRESRSGRVILERQVSGVCHRLFIAHGKLLYAVRRDPMTIFGDGIRSIEQIISDEASIQALRPPWCRDVAPSLDDGVMTILKLQGLTLNSVPKVGVAIALRRIESTAWGGCDEEVTERIHPENLSIALRAAKLFRLSSAGVDIITENISDPWYENGAIINEVNFAPLLGGAQISRSYIPEYLSRLIDGDGKIPIEVHARRADCLSRRQYWQA